MAVGWARGLVRLRLSRARLVGAPPRGDRSRTRCDAVVPRFARREQPRLSLAQISLIAPRFAPNDRTNQGKAPRDEKDPPHPRRDLSVHSARPMPAVPRRHTRDGMRTGT